MPDDGRLRRGARSRVTVLRHAVDIASRDSLDGLSFSQLGDAAQLSKAGVQGLFSNKETLQLATIEYARALFVEAVIEPARQSPPGLPRLRALLEHWIVYAQTPLFAGGCFRVANLATFDSRHGAVRDALVRDQRSWLATLARDIGDAVAVGDLGALDPERTAFEIDAVLCATNTALRLGDADAVPRARLIIDGILGR